MLQVYLKPSGWVAHSMQCILCTVSEWAFLENAIRRLFGLRKSSTSKVPWHCSVHRHFYIMLGIHHSDSNRLKVYILGKLGQKYVIVLIGEPWKVTTESDNNAQDWQSALESHVATRLCILHPGGT